MIKLKCLATCMVHYSEISIRNFNIAEQGLGSFLFLSDIATNHIPIIVSLIPSLCGLEFSRIVDHREVLKSKRNHFRA